jgi:hypothetical protein
MGLIRKAAAARDAELKHMIDAALFAIDDDALTAERLASIRRKLGGTDKRVVVEEC